jgi:hypothetical protein
MLTVLTDRGAIEGVERGLGASNAWNATPVGEPYNASNATPVGGALGDGAR